MQGWGENSNLWPLHEIRGTGQPIGCPVRIGMKIPG